MNKKMNKKIFTIINIIILSTSFQVLAADNASSSILDSILPSTKNCNYVDKKLYQPFSSIDNTFPGSENLMEKGKNNIDCIKVGSGTENMLKSLFIILISVIIILTVVSISVSGIQYMTEEAINKKGLAKKRLTNSFIALGLGLFSYSILYTINKQLVEFDFNPSKLDTSGAIQKGIDSAVKSKESGTMLSDISGIEALMKPVTGENTVSGWQNPYNPTSPQLPFSEAFAGGNFSTYASFGSIKCYGASCSASKPTVFGYKDGDGTVGTKGDNGIGNSLWSTKPGCTYDTGNTVTKGVALPKGFWGSAGINFSDVKYIGIKIYVNGVSKTILPVVDDSQSNLDFTFAAAKEYIDPTITNSNNINTSGKKITFEIIKDYYKSNVKSNIVWTSNQSTFSKKIPCNI